MRIRARATIRFRARVRLGLDNRVRFRSKVLLRLGFILEVVVKVNCRRFGLWLGLWL